ncbi:hypothetical protein L2E82_45292 [Cichorium intybus]|uniref:Uncharacterized protein n=2 Tax=Cichorium intybus TaxID=13427 RepID=A0ACB8ZTI9_CICIN|nr:hypothetical protein L2E82_45281 [Cichorium intybus]KAI3700655.1 hypothetical protein L2E82_45292 [Cichorium intybus]
MAKAAIKSHAPTLYSLALIQFSGSGGLKNEKDLHASVVLCVIAAFLDHIDALRELDNCLQHGSHVRKNIVEGCRLLVQANTHTHTPSLQVLPAPPSNYLNPSLIPVNQHPILSPIYHTTINRHFESPSKLSMSILWIIGLQ